MIKPDLDLNFKPATSKSLSTYSKEKFKDVFSLHFRYLYSRCTLLELNHLNKIDNFAYIEMTDFLIKNLVMTSKDI